MGGRRCDARQNLLQLVRFFFSFPPFTAWHVAISVFLSVSSLSPFQRGLQTCFMNQCGFPNGWVLIHVWTFFFFIIKRKINGSSSWTIFFFIIKSALTSSYQEKEMIGKMGCKWLIQAVKDLKDMWIFN